MSTRNRGGGWAPRGPELLGILLIVVGVVYFLANANIVRISWNLVWPILVIGLGAIFLRSAMRSGGDRPGSIQIPRDGSEQLEFDLMAGGGTFRVGGGAGQLVDVRSNRGDITSRVDRTGIRTRIRVRQDARWFPFGGGVYSEWDVRLADDVPTALVIEGGAGTFDVDLSTLRIVDARLTFGAAQVRMVLPHPAGEVKVKLSSGAASVAIQVPPGVEARVAASGGLLRVEGRNETPGYGSAQDRVTVTVTGGATTVRVL